MMRPRPLGPSGQLGRRLMATLVAVAMLASTPGLTPSVTAQDDPAAPAAEVAAVETEPTPAEVAPEPVAEEAATEEVPVVAPEPVVEETSPPVDEAIPPVDEAVEPEPEPVVERTPAVDETAVVADETTVAEEPPLPSEGDPVDPTVAAPGTATPTPTAPSRTRRQSVDDMLVAAAVNLTVTLALSPTGSPVAGTSVTGTASWTNATAGPPTGTVLYRAFTGGGCTGALYAEAGTKTIAGATAPSGSAPASDAVTMNAAGAHSWQVSYGGDVNYNPSTVCVNQTIAKRTPTIALSVSPSPSVAGTALTGTSNLANLTTTATGNLTYALYTNSACSTALTASGSPNVKVVGGGVAPTSDPITVNYAPTVYWRAVYAGDANNNTITSACVAVTMAKRTPTLSIAVTSASGVAGQPAFNQATLTNATSNAVGTVTYGIYTTNTCSTTLTLTGNTHTKTVAGGVVPVSNTLTIPRVTTYWRASYGGDTYNNPTASDCFLLTLAKSSPTITLTITPTLSPMKAAGTARGTAVFPTSGSAAATTGAGGSAVYTVYKDSACSVVLVAASTKTVTNRSIAASNTTTINQAGFVYWRVVYSGDANNNGVTSACVALAVAKADPVSSLAFTYGATPMKAGGTARARGTFTSASTTSTATGTLTYAAYTDSACTALLPVAGNPHNKTVTNRSTGSSNYLTFPNATTYYWRMSFLGDANNNASTSPCTAMAVARSTPTLTLTTVPVSAPMRAGGAANGRVTMTLSNAIAGGTATYTVYTDSTCTTAYAVTGSPSTVTVTNKIVPNSAAITFPTVGTYYWRATYSGDADNGAAASACVALVVGTSTPTLTLTTSPAGSVPVEGSASGVASLVGTTASAGGTATYTVYTDSACTTQLPVAGNPSAVTVVDGVVPVSTTITFSAAGTDYWRVTYGGDANNGAATSACVALNVTRAAPMLGLVVTASVSPMAAGGTAYGEAALTGTSSTASGSVVYTVYSDNLCTAPVSPGKTSTEAVSGGTVGDSDTFTFDEVGTFYWLAGYGGDANNEPTTSPCVALNVVDGAEASVDLSVAPNPIVVGGSARGVATLSGVTATAGGTVAYTVYADSGCATPVSPAKTSTVGVVNGVAPNSATFLFAQSGLFYWSAVYSGDPNNDGHTSPCIGLTVAKASPSLTISIAPSPVKAGSGAVGTATLTGGSATAAGTATFTVYTNSLCTAAVAPPLSSARTVADGVVPASGALTVQQVGTVYWRVVYTGDANNNAATSTCLSVTVGKATPTVSLTVTPGAISVWGEAAGAAGLANAAAGAGGSLVYSVYRGDDCAGAAAGASPVTVSGGAAPISGPFMFEEAGTFSWRAAYGGDANNAAAESPCVPLVVEGGPLTVSVASVTMAPVTYSDAERTNTGTMVLSVVDRRGTGDGWSVSLSVSDFAYAGASPTGAGMPAGNFGIVTAYGPVHVEGQPIDGANGPAIPTGGATGPLDAPVVVLVAGEGYGAGAYTQTYDVALVIPGGSQVGTYTAVVDAVTSAAP